MLVGSMLRSIAETDRDFWLRWKALMSDVMSSAVAQAFGQKPDMIEQPAPEHEKAGRA